MSDLHVISKSTVLKNKEKKYEASICISKIDNPNEYGLLEECLNVKEREHYLGIKSSSRKNSFLHGRYVAKTAVSNLIGCDLKEISIGIGIFNYPIVEINRNKKYNVSLSHCRSIGAAIAFEEDIIIGIDIEEIKLGFESRVYNSLVENEKLLISKNKCLEIESSAVIWTAKEALSKAIKTGLTVPLGILEVKEITYKENYYICTFRNFSQYKAISIATNRYACSIVIPKQLEIEIDIVQIKKLLEE